MKFFAKILEMGQEPSHERSKRKAYDYAARSRNRNRRNLEEISGQEMDGILLVF